MCHMSAKISGLVFFVVLLASCAEEPTALPPIDSVQLSRQAKLPAVLGVSNLSKGCGDELATNYVEGVSLENDDCSCVYEDFDKPGIENTRDFVFRNVFLEIYNSTVAPEGPVLDFIADIAVAGIEELAKTYGIESGIVRITTHAEGEESSVYGAERYSVFKRNFPRLEQRLSQASEETDFILPYYTIDNAFADRGSFYFNAQKLFEEVSGRLSPIPSAYISVQTRYKAEEGVLEGLVSFRFRVPDDGRIVNHFYEVLLVEDQVTAPQANGAPNLNGIRNIYPVLFAAPATIPEYKHKNLVREKITEGAIKSFVTLLGNDVYSRRFDYFVPRINKKTKKEYNFDNFYVVVLVMEGEENNVLNAEIVPLTGSVSW